MKADVERWISCFSCGCGMYKSLYKCHCLLGGKTTDIGIVFIHNINKKGNNVLIYCNGVRKYLECIHNPYLSRHHYLHV